MMLALPGALSIVIPFAPCPNLTTLCLSLDAPIYGPRIER